MAVLPKVGQRFSILSTHPSSAGVCKILVPDRKKIPRGVGIAGFRGYRKILSGYRTNLKSKI
jgi:hypothetical protein